MLRTKGLLALPMRSQGSSVSPAAGQQDSRSATARQHEHSWLQQLSTPAPARPCLHVHTRQAQRWPCKAFQRPCRRARTQIPHLLQLAVGARRRSQADVWQQRLRRPQPLGDELLPSLLHGRGDACAGDLRLLRLQRPSGGRCRGGRLARRRRRRRRALLRFLGQECDGPDLVGAAARLQHAGDALLHLQGSPAADDLILGGA
jgi:hypothetical protein